MTASDRPWGYAVFAAMLASAGLPIYIHAPKFFADSYGVGLAALGGALFLLRLLDVVQDPVLGWLSERLRGVRAISVGVATVVMALAMVGLFAVAPPFSPLIWFAVTLAALFSAFSFLTICFYAQGVVKAGSMGAHGHVRLGAWRETGALIGVCVAAVVPTVLLGLTESPFTWFALGFVALAGMAMIAMRAEWGVARVAEPGNLRAILSDRIARRLLLIALVNATPVAVTSTLFLFFVESRLGVVGAEGPLLLLFFLAAALSAPVWGLFAGRIGAKRALQSGMALAIVAFGFALTLGTGDLWAFAVICAVSGAALGADMTLLPALFAARMARIAPNAGQGFGLWSFVSKASLAFAAVTLLPALELSGFRSGAENPEAALVMLTLLYAALPCLLKIVALILLSVTPVEEVKA